MYKIYALIKRFFELIISLILLILLLPLFFIISICIKLDSKGSVFFKQKRITKNGKIFKIIKFRTMIPNAEKTGAGLFNYSGDNRITKVGKILRKSSLDELPQLINVLIGDMSFIGPRPPVEFELGEYKNLNAKYKKRFEVKAGITGLAQVKGRNDLNWEEKVFFDNLYVDKIKKQMLFLDIKIMFLTIINIFKQKDIYEELDSDLLGKSAEEIDKIMTQRVIENATKKDEEYTKEEVYGKNE